jgi:YVTN family beta-propeller protein
VGENAQKERKTMKKAKTLSILLVAVLLISAVPTFVLALDVDGTLLKGIAVDEVRNLVYVAVQSNNTIAIVDGATQLFDYAVPCGGVGPNGLALSENSDKLFVANSGSDQVAVLDANSGYAVLATIDVGRKPFGVAIAGGIAYVTNFDDRTVTLIDVSTLAVLDTVGVGHHPGLPAAVGDHAYVPIHSQYLGWRSKDPVAERDYVQRNRGSDTGVAIVYSDGRVERILQEHIGFFAAAVDEANERVYITKRDGTAEGLYVLNLVDSGLLKFVPMLRPYAVAANPITNHAFVVQGDMDEVYVLDGADDYRMIRAADTDPNNGDVPGQHGGQGIGVNGDEVYVSNYVSGTLTILDDMDTSAKFAVPLDTDYIRGWMESGGNHGPLGDPAAPSYGYWYAEQQYERGSMQWRQVMTGTNQIYVFDNESTQPGGTDWNGRDSGLWAQYDDNWVSGMPLFPAGCPDAGWPHGPMFGFGVTWCDEPGVKDTIGYPIGGQYGTLGGDQAFANGSVFWNPDSDAYYVLRNDTMRWQYYRAHRRYHVDEVEANVSGQVRLQGRADHSGTILVSPQGPHTATAQDGSFGLNYQGQTTLRISHPGYLDVLATIKADASTLLDLNEIVLLGGDVNGDNCVDILDVSYVGYHFSSADAQADLTGDGVVNILDLSIVGANFGQAGPILWSR